MLIHLLPALRRWPQELRDRVAEKEAAKARAEEELRAAAAAHATALEEARREAEARVAQVGKCVAWRDGAGLGMSFSGMVWHGMARHGAA